MHYFASEIANRPASVAFLRRYRPLVRHSPNGFKHVFTGIRLSEISCATCSFGRGARIRIVMSGNKDDGYASPFSRQLPGELDARHAIQLDVKYQATELWTLGVCQERLR